MRLSRGSPTAPPAYQQWNDEQKPAPTNEKYWNDDASSQQQYSDEKLDARDSLDSNGGTIGTPIKTYKILSNHIWTQKLYEVQKDGQPILWVRNKRKLLKAPIINIHAGSDHGDILASCKLSCWKRHLRFNLGNPDCTNQETWPMATCGSWTGKVYAFDVGGQSYQWKRTHNKQLGASKWGSKNFKLVDADGNVLAVFVFTQSLFGKLKQIGELHYYRELGQEAELASLAILTGIEETIRQNEQAAAGA